MIQDLDWDLVIGHSPCQYLSNAGGMWLEREEGRKERVHDAAELFCSMASAYPERNCFRLGSAQGIPRQSFREIWVEIGEIFKQNLGDSGAKLWSGASDCPARPQTKSRHVCCTTSEHLMTSGRTHDNATHFLPLEEQTSRSCI